MLLPLPLEELGGRKGGETSQNPGRKAPGPEDGAWGDREGQLRVW